MPSAFRSTLGAVLAFAIGGQIVGCRSTAPSPQPTVKPPAPSPTERTVATGTVFERASGGRTPLPFATVDAVSTTTLLELGRATAGPDGRFTISGLDTDSDPIFVFGGFNGFRQPCAAPATVGGARDLDVVSDPALSGLALPSDLVVPMTVSGTVFESGSTTAQPVAFAYVAVMAGLPDVDDAGWYVAETMSDAQGAYELCGLPRGTYTAQAGLGTLFGESPVTVGSTPARVDILLAPLPPAPAARRRVAPLLAAPDGRERRAGRLKR